MSVRVTPQVSPRHSILFNSVPTKRGSIFGGSVTVHYPKQYGPILDCVFEMADQIKTGNGIPAAMAIETVLTDEGWTLLPSHKQVIVNMLEKD